MVCPIVFVAWMLSCIATAGLADACVATGRITCLLLLAPVPLLLTMAWDFGAAHLGFREISLHFLPVDEEEEEE